MCDVEVNKRVPVGVEVVSNLSISAILLKSHAWSVIVGATVVGSNGGGYALVPPSVGKAGLERAETACAEREVGAGAVLLGLSGNDVDNAPHGVAPVEH